MVVAVRPRGATYGVVYAGIVYVLSVDKIELPIALFASILAFKYCPGVYPSVEVK